MPEIIYTVPKDEKGKELVTHGTSLFPCEIYDRDVHQYITNEIPPHWHHDMELFLLIEGNAHLSFTDAEYDLKPGEGFFANSGVLHGISCPSGDICHYHSMVFDPMILSGASGSAYDLLYLRPFMEHGSPVRIFRPHDNTKGDVLADLFSSAFDACASGADGYEFVARNLLSQIFLILKEFSDYKKDRKNSQQELRMKQMLSWLDEHYMEEISVSQLADAAGICVRECQRSFANILHTTPIRYLNRRRITIAAGFLVSTDMSISEIGLCCGFDNPSYFTKQFKEIIGMTPKSYRKKYTSASDEDSPN